MFFIVTHLCKADDLKGGPQWTSTIYINVCHLMLLLFPSEHCRGYKYILLELLCWQTNFTFTGRTAYGTAKHNVQLLPLWLLHWNCSRSWFLLVNTAVLRQRVPAEPLGTFSTHHYKRDCDLNSPILPPLCIQNSVDPVASSALLHWQKKEGARGRGEIEDSVIRNF